MIRGKKPQKIFHKETLYLHINFCLITIPHCPTNLYRKPIHYASYIRKKIKNKVQFVKSNTLDVNFMIERAIYYLYNNIMFLLF